MCEPDLARWRELLDYREVWVFTIALVAALPLLGYIRFRRFLAQASPVLSQAGKFGLYARIASTQWLLAAAMALILRRHGLSMADAGERFGDRYATLTATGGLLMILAIVAALVLRCVRRSPAENLSGAMGRVRMMAPATAQEFAAFALVCATAGICEELLFRGWLVSLLWAATRSRWAAVAIGGVLFGAGHAYQGVRGVLRTGFVGLQLGILFVLLGSLIPGQALHAGVDLLAGAASVAIASRTKAA